MSEELDGRWEVPEEWQWARIGDVAEIVGGGTPSTDDPTNFSDDDIPWITPSDLSNYDGTYISKGSRDLSKKGLDSCGAKLVPKGTVLFSSRAPIGYCAIASNSVSTNQGFRSLVLNDQLVPEFVRYYLLSSIPYIEQHASGTTYPEISGSQLAKLLILVPPLPTQRRIAARLDALTARADRARDHLEAIPPLVDKFKKSLLARAYTGELTADWRAENPDVEPASELLERIRAERKEKWIHNYAANLADRARKRAEKKGEPFDEEDWQAYYDKKIPQGEDRYEEPEPVDPKAEDLPEIPETWAWVRLGHLLADIQAGKSPRAGSRPAEDGEYGVLKVSAVSWEQFLPDENKVLPDDYDVDPSHLVAKGDLLISRANTTELVGAVVIVDDDYANLMLSDKTLKLVPAADNIDREYLLYTLRTPAVRKYFEARATGTSDSMRNLSQEKIRSVPIPFPPMTEQAAIVKRCRKQVEASEKAQTKAIQQANRLDRFNQSLLNVSLAGSAAP